VRVLGDARNVSLVYAAATCVGLLASQGIPLLIRRLGPLDLRAGGAVRRRRAAPSRRPARQVLAAVMLRGLP
jgi:hypothetical protein